MVCLGLEDEARDDHYEGGYRYILVRILLTMCVEPRNDVIVFDRAGGGKYLLFQLHTSDIRFYSCDPTCKFNYDEVEEGYRRYIAFVQLEYSHKRGVQRVCKHWMTSASYKKHPDIIRRGVVADESHQ